MITLSSLPNALVNESYSQTITASGGSSPYTFAVTAGALPTGLTLGGSTGIVSGTATTAGYSSFTITATDSVSATGSQAYNFYVSGKLYWFICTSAAYPSAVPVVAGSQLAFNRLTATSLAGLSRSRHEVGDLLARPDPSPVNGHLLCDGSAVGRIDFPQLFQAIGTEWGAGDGSTTFNIPNLVTATLPISTTAPTQTVGDTTVSTSNTVTQPSGSQTGGSSGGNYSSGGRIRTAIS